MRPNDQKFVAQSARIVQTLVEEGACRSEMVGLSVDFAFGPPPGSNVDHADVFAWSHFAALALS